MYFQNIKDPIHQNILIACVELQKIRVRLAHRKHIRLGKRHHRLQKQPFQLTNIHRLSLLLEICSTTLLLVKKLLNMAKTRKIVNASFQIYFYKIH